MKNKNISLAQDTLRKFTWDSFADWYLEINKLEKNIKVLGYVLDKLLRMWHPFTPFVTEEIYQQMFAGEKILMIASWPKSEKKFIDLKVRDSFVDLQELIVKIRNIRASYHIDPINLIKAYGGKKIEKEIIEKLARVEIEISKEIREKMVQVNTISRELQLDIAKSIDVEKEILIIDREVENLKNLISKNEGMLKNKNFVAGAPKEVVQATKARTKGYKDKLKIQNELRKNITMI